jgi:hypothetical protein
MLTRAGFDVAGFFMRSRFRFSRGPTCGSTISIAGRSVRLFERGEEQLAVRVTERELQVRTASWGGPPRTVDRRAFREAFINAVTHRDYTRMGRFVRWQAETLSISSPGGFVEGVRLDNLLTVEPRPRNPGPGGRVQADRACRADRARRRSHLPGRSIREN